MMRKVVCIGKKVGQNQIRNVRPGFVTNKMAIMNPRQFSTLLDAREKAAENIYFREQETARLNEIRAKFEKIISSKDHPDREEVLELLEVKPDKNSGIISQLGLDDWKFALPIGMILAVPALATEVLVLNEETQLLAVFILALSTLYTQGGGMIGKALDSYSDDILQKLKAVDESILAESKSAIEENKKLLTLDVEYKDFNQLVDDLSIAQADILNYTAEHKYRDAIVKKLDSLVAMEEATTAAIRHRMVSTVTADVISQFASDKKIKEAALEQAISVLASGSSGKLGKDVVGGVFTSSLKSYRDSYAKKSPQSDDILMNLQKEMAAVAVPPVIEGLGEGGNVYLTHPVLKA